MISTEKKKLLHVAKGEIGLTDEQYRSILREHTGYDSSARQEFCDWHFKAVLDHFKLVYGFQVKSRFHQNYPRDPYALASPEHLRKLDHVVEDYSQYNRAAASREYQRGFNERVIKRPWPQTRKEVNKMIEAWAARLRRAEAKARDERAAVSTRTVPSADGFTRTVPMGGAEGAETVGTREALERSEPPRSGDLPEECPF